MSRIRSLFRNLLQRELVERELDDDLRAYQQMLIEEKRASGLSEEDAIRADVPGDRPAPGGQRERSGGKDGLDAGNDMARCTVLLACAKRLQDSPLRLL